MSNNGLGTRRNMSIDLRGLLAAATLPLVLICDITYATTQSPHPDRERGVQLYRDGDYERASQVLDKATQNAPSDARAWTYLGLSKIELGKATAALAPLQKAVVLDDQLSEAHYGLGLAYGYLSRLPEAIRELERAVELNPTYAAAHYQLGLAFNEANKLDRALLHLERFLELEPQSPEAPRVKDLLSRLR